MSRHRDEHLALCAAHVVGALDDAGRVELEEHLAGGCEVCLAELRALSGGLTVFALSLPHHPAPAGARARVMAAVRTEAAKAAKAKVGDEAMDSSTSPAERGAAEPAIVREEPRITPLPARPRPSFASWAWAAAAVVLAVAGVFSWRHTEELSAVLEGVRMRNDALRDTLESVRRVTRILEAPGGRMARLAPTAAGDTALTARVHFDPGTRQAVLYAQAFTPGAGRDYELWAITPTGPSSLGVVRADAAGHAVMLLEDVGDPATLAGFAVSLEPAGGSPDPHKPSGPVVMFGPIGG